jgi:hypothetical protein
MYMKTWICRAEIACQNDHIHKVYHAYETWICRAENACQDDHIHKVYHAYESWICRAENAAMGGLHAAGISTCVSLFLFADELLYCR